MKPYNLISVIDGSCALEQSGLNANGKFRILKSHEINTLQSFCNAMKNKGCGFRQFDGFFVGYSIEQIGKEFDLLRFGNEYILNIELKSELSGKVEEKVHKQMAMNYHYLKFLGMPIIIFTYVENDGFYQYDIEDDSITKISADAAAKILIYQTVDYSANPDLLFVPSNYLISPFNSTDKFINNEYFLTPGQRNAKNEILDEMSKHPFMFSCISANAGTGKTLLLYDVAKELMRAGKRVLIIHCGKLNEGHERLNGKYHWNIISIGTVNSWVAIFALAGCDCIFVDEAQRIREGQLCEITKKAVENKIPVIFSYDVKQFLRDGETRNISDYLEKNYHEAFSSTKNLKNKIRTNKSMASFITNLMNIGRSHDNLNYDCVSIEFIERGYDIKSYIDLLRANGWRSITYTTSKIDEEKDPYINLIDISDKNAHDVIGQEFSKVVFVMDENFWYDENGSLKARESYYSALGMLYQIVTRVVNELKIIVTRNPELYYKLLEIKSMGD
ncbi:MAG: DUF2075 domain-containing protein [Butyrivibrio sp.]|nr:DUF2075 domain-containing protein [Butyrivibrio sp.]